MEGQEHCYRRCGVSRSMISGFWEIPSIQERRQILDAFWHCVVYYDGKFINIGVIKVWRIDKWFIRTNLKIG